MGAIEEAKGKIKQAVGDLTDDTDTRREGLAQEAKGEQEQAEEKARAEAREHREKADEAAREQDRIARQN
jgi:uncharacterized protein YjbJ (UPF0337 family)